MAMSALEVWRMIPQTPEVIGFFTGIFDVIGVTIAETGEELTVAIEGDADVVTRHRTLVSGQDLGRGRRT